MVGAPETVFLKHLLALLNYIDLPNLYRVARRSRAGFALAVFSLSPPRSMATIVYDRDSTRQIYKCLTLLMLRKSYGLRISVFLFVHATSQHSMQREVEVEMYTANGWVNYYVGVLWLIAFVVFVLMKYPSEKE
ncbi:hypothetical protein [Alicyclobacillus mengziensis]|uniref:Uncharacterized protein n=1 Tax=Alicyclobacillus mengziensis TaxID=2931921 RepID=A0A9X7VXM5_9BACL|nr:hypothetical protein [Alicyclobacillus mengziensis]QSO46918.1 hypothetical protein JZ786_21215 [Alicyclobacillus mengziensis]